MRLKEIQNCERTKIEKWSQFQLSNQWKTFGLILVFTLIIASAILKFTEIEMGLFKDVLRRGILVGLLIVSLSKEKYEDEMIVSLRAKSYTLAFIFGVGYTLVQPLAELFVNEFIFTSNTENTFSYFDVLFYMLLIQIMFFEVLKRNR